MKAIVCVGAVYMDTILTVPHFPEEDKKLRASKHVVRRGGNCANTLNVLEQLVEVSDSRSATAMSTDDTPLYLLSVLPSRLSDATKAIRDSFHGTNLDSTCIFRQNVYEAASSYIINNETTGSRTIVSYNELPEMDFEEFVTSAAEISLYEEINEGWYHFEGRIPEVTARCVKHLREVALHQEFKISIECEKPEREGLMEAVKQADVVFYSKIWAESQGYTTASDFLESQIQHTRSNAILCCTWGASGATIVAKSPDSRNLERATASATASAWHPADVTQPVIDTVGAGDTFIAGMIYALVHHANDWGLAKKLEFANELAGRKVYQDGFHDLVTRMVSDRVADTKF